jgi:hypothetical protein
VLIAGLRELEREGVCILRIPVMEKMTLQEQFAEVASSTVSQSKKLYSALSSETRQRVLTCGLRIVDHCRRTRERPHAPDVHAAFIAVGCVRDRLSRW